MNKQVIQLSRLRKSIETSRSWYAKPFVIKIKKSWIIWVLLIILAYLIGTGQVHAQTVTISKPQILLGNRQSTDFNPSVLFKYPSPSESLQNRFIEINKQRAEAEAKARESCIASLSSIDETIFKESASQLLKRVPNDIIQSWKPVAGNNMIVPIPKNTYEANSIGPTSLNGVTNTIVKRRGGLCENMETDTLIRAGMSIYSPQKADSQNIELLWKRNLAVNLLRENPSIISMAYDTITGQIILNYGLGQSDTGNGPQKSSVTNVVNPIKLIDTAREKAQEAKEAQLRASRAITLDRTVPSTVQPVYHATINCGSDPYMAYIYMHESGCNTASVNSIGCSGLGQKCGYLSCSLSDWNCQDSYFRSYAISRYGSYYKAYLFWVNNRWW